MSAPADRLLTPSSAQPFSRPFVVDDVPEDSLEQMIEADHAECNAVAREIGLPAVGRLAARYRITRGPGHRFHVDGVVEATITQNCVVSLEPFDSDLTQAVDLTFALAAPPEPLSHRRAPTASRRRERTEMREPAPAPRVVDGEDDPPEPIINGRIDLGAIAVEFLTLTLDFYPRKPGVQFSDMVGEKGDEKPSAFAALARLKDPS